MNVYRTNPMRTRLSFAKSTVPAVLFLLGSSTTVFAQDNAAPTAEPPAKPAPAADTPAAAETKTEATNPASDAPEASAAPDPASITEVGIQRLPGSAYPEPLTRGLPYGSLSLTFHGMQWPYMPATAKGSRFVLGLSGWGWVDTAYQKFAPWGDYTGLGTSKSTYWKQQARLVTRVTPTYSLDDGWFIQGQA